MRLENLCSHSPLIWGQHIKLSSLQQLWTGAGSGAGARHEGPAECTAVRKSA